jgi:heme/copper-type cytochrome/quinol oxidase subunit 2
LTALFWTCAAAIVVAQVMILRSTWRARRHVGAGPAAEKAGSAVLEWLFAIGPAIALALLLAATWRATTRGPEQEVRFDGATVSSVRNVDARAARDETA